MSNLLLHMRAGAKALTVGFCLAGFLPALQAQLFFDDFTRTNDPGSLSPWVAQAGTWTVTGGVLLGGTNTPQTYGFVLLTNTWTNYSVEASIRLPTGAYGAGLGGRLNPATGRHYAAWIYPEGSPGGSNILRLVKFLNWANWSSSSFLPVAQVPLASVGTNWHTLKVAFQGNQIAVYYDGVKRISAVDVEAAFYPVGGVSLDVWTAATPYQISVDDVRVDLLPLAANDDSYALPAGTNLVVAAPGVLANDGGGAGPLSAYLLSGPSHGVLNLSSNGGFSYQPAPGFTGADSFAYAATDGTTNAASATVTLSVDPMVSLFSDDFDRTTDPGPLSPWVAQSGNWTVTGSALVGGTNVLHSYGFALLTNNWTDYSVESRFRFPGAVYGGGLGGRLNPTTGAHYAAWVYPEGSPAGGSSLRLVKFQNWTNWGYAGKQFTPMQSVALTGVGTNWHTVKLTFQDRFITVSYDGVQRITTEDLESQFLPSGGICAGVWTDTTPYIMEVDHVTVTTPGPSLAALAILPDANSATVTVTFSGTAGNQYLVQTATNLAPPVIWSSVSTNTAGTNGLWSFTDSITNASRRFYRAAEPGS
jgi:hypothetical protein